MHMKYAILAASLLLAACGQGGGQTQSVAQGGDTCALIADSAAVFGTEIAGREDRPADNAAAGECAWESEDGTIVANLILYRGAPETKFDETITTWRTLAQEGVEPQTLEGVGDAATLVAPMMGYQAQIAVRKGDALALVLANSGADGRDSAAVARAMAEAVAGAL